MTSQRYRRALNDLVLDADTLTELSWPRATNLRWTDYGRFRVLRGDEAAHYLPGSEPALFRRFANLQDTEAAFVRFAETYGSLWRPWQVGHTLERLLEADEDLDVDPDDYPWDSLAQLTYERRLLALAVRLWQTVAEGRPKDALGREVTYEPTGAMLRVLVDEPSNPYCEGLMEVMGWAPRDLHRPLFLPRKSSARTIVQAALADLLSRECGARIALAASAYPAGDETNAGVLRLAFAVDDLRSALWLQFALAVNGNRKYDTCPVCGEIWDRTGVRRDRETCTDACRKRRSREAQGGTNAQA